MLSSPRSTCRLRAFDLILNLGVHAHLLEPITLDDSSTIEEEYSQESYLAEEAQFNSQGKKNPDSPNNISATSSINKFECWILNILYEILLLLVQVCMIFHAFVKIFLLFNLDSSVKRYRKLFSTSASLKQFGSVCF